MWLTTGAVVTPRRSLSSVCFPVATIDCACPRPIVYAQPRSLLGAPPPPGSPRAWSKGMQRSAIMSVPSPVRASALQRGISSERDARSQDPALTQRQEREDSVDRDQRCTQRARAQTQQTEEYVNCEEGPAHLRRTTQRRAVRPTHQRSSPSSKARGGLARQREDSLDCKARQHAKRSEASEKSDAAVQFTSSEEQHVRALVASLEHRVRNLESLLESERVAREESEQAAREVYLDSALRTPPGHRALAEQAEEVPLRPKTLILTGGASARGLQQSLQSHRKKKKWEIRGSAFQLREWRDKSNCPEITLDRDLAWTALDRFVCAAPLNDKVMSAEPTFSFGPQVSGTEKVAPFAKFRCRSRECSRDEVESFKDQSSKRGHNWCCAAHGKENVHHP